MYGYNVIGAAHPGYGHGNSAYGLSHQPANTGLSLDEVKNWFEQETLGVKRKNLAMGAVALAEGYYGYTQGWFR